MSEFSNKATMRFFERMGVKLVVERGERVFPESGKAADIANALEFFCRDYDVEIQCNSRVTAILTSGGKVYGLKYMNKRGFERRIEVANIIVTTGGVSYPATGSTGDGYAFALGNHWNLELELGVGYAYMNYDVYDWDTDQKMQSDAHHNYVGITKLNVGLSYLF